MKRSKLQIVAATGVMGSVVAGVSGIGYCQVGVPLVTPQDLEPLKFRPGARVTGMGGSYLFSGRFDSAAPYNPAADLRSNGSLNLTASSENLDVNEIVDLASSIGDLTEQVDEGGGANTVTGVQEAFNEVFESAQGTGGRPIRASVATANTIPLPFIKKVGFTYLGGFSSNVTLTTRGTTQGTRVLDVSGGLLGLDNFGLPISMFTRYGKVGIAPKIVGAAYGGFQYTANESTTTADPATGTPPNTIQGTTFDFENDYRPSADIGFISHPYTKRKLQGAVVVRNILSPKFQIRSEDQNGVARNFDFKLKPSIDFGVKMPLAKGQGTLLGEVHNLTSGNNTDRTFHIGAEYQVGKILALRTGYDQKYKFTYGAGFRIGKLLSLDVAAAKNPRERFSVGFSILGF